MPFRHGACDGSSPDLSPSTDSGGVSILPPWRMCMPLSSSPTISKSTKVNNLLLNGIQQRWRGFAMLLQQHERKTLSHKDTWFWWEKKGRKASILVKSSIQSQRFMGWMKKFLKYTTKKVLPLKAINLDTAHWLGSAMCLLSSSWLIKSPLHSFFPTFIDHSFVVVRMLLIEYANVMSYCSTSQPPLPL